MYNNLFSPLFDDFIFKILSIFINSSNDSNNACINSEKLENREEKCYNDDDEI